MNWLRGIFSTPDELGEMDATLSQKTSLTGTCRLPSPGSRIIVKTAEDKEIYLAKEDLHLLRSLQRMVDDLGTHKDGAEPTVVVPIACTFEQLLRIVTWCKSTETADCSTRTTLLFPDDVQQLLKYIELAQFFDISSLEDCLSQRVANLLEPMDCDTMRKALGREGKPPCSQEQLKELEELKKIFDC